MKRSSLTLRTQRRVKGPSDNTTDTDTSYNLSDLYTLVPRGRRRVYGDEQRQDLQRSQGSNIRTTEDPGGLGEKLQTPTLPPPSLVVLGSSRRGLKRVGRRVETEKRERERETKSDPLALVTILLGTTPIWRQKDR